jgi:hypothetical protein
MITLTVNGLAQFQRMAEKSPALAQKYADSAIAKSIGEIDRNSAPITPVDTHRLRDSIQQGNKFSPFKGSIGTSLPYAVRVHDMYSPGTPYRNPSKNKSAVAGFLTVAVGASEGTINSLFAEALEGFVKELQS